ncbi:hypothetical protein GN956_G5139 [Arapaima gigas]
MFRSCHVHKEDLAEAPGGGSCRPSRCPKQKCATRRFHGAAVPLRPTPASRPRWIECVCRHRKVAGSRLQVATC